jgi:hypothetical protein
MVAFLGEPIVKTQSETDLISLDLDVGFLSVVFEVGLVDVLWLLPLYFLFVRWLCLFDMVYSKGYKGKMSTRDGWVRRQDGS